jgi:iron-sulfur cluster assembly protein
MRADLHLHSHYSDGADSPAAVVARAQAAGLDLIALTDHDSLGGWPEARAAAAKAGIELLPAAEFTATHRGREIHLQGYFPAPPGREVADHLKRMQAFRRRRIETALERLRQRGVPVSFDELPCAPQCESVTSAHLALLLAERGYARTTRTAWRGLLSRKRGLLPGFEITAEEVIRVIHAGGGLAVWAHPERQQVRRNLEELAALGLDGIEAANGRRGLQPARDWQALARTMGLVATGGSDWHGGNGLGDFAADEELLADFLARLRRAPAPPNPDAFSAVFLCVLCASALGFSGLRPQLTRPKPLGINDSGAGKCAPHSYAETTTRMSLQLTETAVGKVIEVLETQNPKPAGLRIGVIGGGCSGFQYQMVFETTPTPMDKVMEFNGLKVFVDQTSYMYLDGTRVDYVESLEGSGFKFENPNVKNTCGCGSSFSV